ncbi:MAG: polysaccharide deacetylase family protein [Eubacteriales bacterium]|nr:polysaccharide deacetylase family protein [Eubacteriales bacterium]
MAALSEKASIDWYTTRGENNQPPPLDGNLRVIDKYNAYYLNRDVRDDDKVIYLTFDAGYENGNVVKILDILKKHEAPAAFFVLAHLVKSETDLVLRMINEGHLVGNHTVKHRDMSLVTDKAQFAEELARLEDIYRQYTGNKMAKYYRPPEGRFSELNLRHATELGYSTVFWSFAYADWDNNNQPDPKTAREKILANTHNGAIILMHPNSATNALILDGLLDEWKARGYRIGSLEELVINNRDESDETQ